MYKIFDFFYYIEIFESKKKYIFFGFNLFIFENVYIVLELYFYILKKNIL